MKNIYISGCKFGENHLINIKDGAILGLKMALFIENNSGNKSIIHVNSLGILNLNGIIFRRNIQCK